MLAIGRGRRLAMLAALSTWALLSTATTVGITPFLLDIARDLKTDLAAAGNLVALQSITWGLVSIFAGAASDRLGRRPLLIAGLVILFLSGLGVARANSYASVAVWRLGGGLGSGTFMGAVFGTDPDTRLRPHRRCARIGHLGRCRAGPLHFTSLHFTSLLPIRR
jgi:MFS transporter, DHA1 family, inner membrane transport protein